ncbi:MAG: D-glycero-beta-D-manno-heptose 1,7-bisphosphate 7-phosphatase [Halioglobus sp.]
MLIILDRDGVINEDSDNYIRSVNDWHPIEGSVAAIADLSRAGYRIAIATNQSGLSRGYFTLDDLELIHGQLRDLVEAEGGQISGIFYCPHLPEERCQCRKPATGLLDAIERELNEPVTGSPFIGDSLKDLQAAEASGCLPMLVRTGKGNGSFEALQNGTHGLEQSEAVRVFSTLRAAADALLAER